MVSRYQSRQKFANKADWEGGILDFILGYGVDLEDLPEDDQELREAVSDILAIEPAVERLRQMLPEPNDDY